MNKNVFIIVVAILLCTIGGMGYMLSQKGDKIDQQESENKQLAGEYVTVQNELYEMRFGFDSLQTNNEDLSIELEARRAEVDRLIKKAKDKDWTVHQLRKEAESLRKIMKGYVVTIDSLNTLNLNLIAENDEFRETVSTVTKENEDLKKQQENMEEIISTGQTLQTSSISASAVRLKSSGGQTDTKRASKTDFIKTCMTVMRNPIAKQGQKNIYLQVIDPDGKILKNADEGAAGDSSGVPQNFSVERAIDYQNEETDVCVFYNVQSELKKGDYTLIVFEQGQKIGQTQLILR